MMPITAEHPALRTRPPATDAGYLTVDSISKRYGSVEALRSVSFTLQRGEMLALLGPSGCGKSTLLNVVSGFLGADGGRILLDGTDVSSVPPHRRMMPMVFQNYALFPHMSVADNIAFGLKQRRVAKTERTARVREALELVRLPNLEKRYPSELSGGQQQRVALARCLVVRPPVLLLDEPLSNLDAQLRDEMRDEMNEILRTSDTTSIFVTHDQSEGLAIADRVLVLRDGVVEQAGEPSEVYEKPRSRFTADFLGVANLWEGRVRFGSGGPRCETALGTIEVNDSASFSDDDPVVLAVRPDRIAIAPLADCERPTLTSGRIVASSYLGRHHRLRVDCGDQVVTVDVPSGAGCPEIGDDVGVMVDSDSCLLVRP
ncbi:MAG: ABC transporter ATP-binding protein [Nocardioidaceae bacterium]